MFTVFVGMVKRLFRISEYTGNPTRMSLDFKLFVLFLSWVTFPVYLFDIFTTLAKASRSNKYVLQTLFTDS